MFAYPTPNTPIFLFVHIAFDEHQIECEILNIKFPSTRFEYIHSQGGTLLCVHGWHEIEMPNSVWNFNVWLPVNLIHVYPHFCFSLSWNIWLLANDFRYNHLQRQTKEEKKNDDKASDNEISDAFKIKGKKTEENQIKTTITNADFVSFPYSCYCVLTVQKV